MACVIYLVEQMNRVCDRWGVNEKKNVGSLAVRGFKGRDVIEGASDPPKRKGFIKGALPKRSLAGGFTVFDGNEGSYWRGSFEKKCCRYTKTFY